MLRISLLLILHSTYSSAQSTSQLERISSAAPEYPEHARERGITGNAEFRADIDEQGRVRTVEILKVPAEDVGFEDAVEECVKKWRFKPAQLEGVTVATSYESFVRFSLRAEDEDAIHQIVREPWIDDTSRTRTRLLIRGDWVDASSVLRDWLTRESSPDEPSDQSVLVDSIQFPPGTPNSAIIRATRYLPGTIKEGLELRATKRSSDWFLIWVGRTWDSDPVLVHKPPDPDYPERARETRMGGTVRILMVVTLEGKTELLDVLTPLTDGLTEAASDNAVQWRWEPALRTGTPVEAVGLIVVTFRRGR